MSDHDYLKEFCGAILAHLEGGDKPEWFTSLTGLCGNFDRFARDRHLDLRNGCRLIIALNFRPFPFNETSNDFDWESRHDRLYLNPQRLTFLKEHAK